MGPEQLRKSMGFAALAAAPLTLLTATPALAQGLALSQWMTAAPIAIALGAGGFGLLAIAVTRARLQSSRRAGKVAAQQIAGLRVLVDQYEALLSASREVTVIWAAGGDGPRILGQTAAILAPGRMPETVLNFNVWLHDGDAARLAQAVEALRVEGRGFELSMKSRDGRLMRASGTAIGGGTALRLRPASEQFDVAEASAQAARAILAALPEPAFLRDAGNRLIFANSAYHQLCKAVGKRSSEAEPAELLEAEPARRAGDIGPVVKRSVALAPVGEFELSEFPAGEGRAGLLRVQAATAVQPQDDASSGHLAGVIDAISIPVAIFDGARELVQYNRAYAELWGLDPKWLQPGLEERTILDRLRTEGKLPSEADYHAWRAKHLSTTYSLKAPRESDPWHLPDGRTINVIATPIRSQGGVIYIFQDITAQLQLRSTNKALLDVQRSTLNSLTEAVAVFGTNGRLTLSNPRLSTLWKLPSNELDQHPHIDQIAASSARALPDDGAAIWRNLKQAIIDLNPERTDTSGRITRADGRLLDYAIVRLPDGQTMMTFLDVTESASYSKVLKERNDALITADRLKDAFVQNVSYELRSPLTNIIGFAELLASPDVGPLNDKQRAYTDYIRASSVTLGVLIDNILDLATVDAGIAELRPEVQSVAALVEKAKAGITATFPEVDGERALNLVVDVPEDLSPLVADGTRVVQILYNLLSSAARFSEPGAEIRLSVTERGEHMIFVVEDEGTAMTEEIRAAVLDRGVEPAMSGRQRGAGLGLAIVRAFVSLHGGTIAVERRQPRGNRVIVSLPRRAAMAGVAE